MNHDFYLQWRRNRDFVRENPSLTATNDVHVNTHCVQSLFITPKMHVLIKIVEILLQDNQNVLPGMDL